MTIRMWFNNHWLLSHILIVIWALSVLFLQCCCGIQKQRWNQGFSVSVCHWNLSFFSTVIDGFLVHVYAKPDENNILPNCYHPCWQRSNGQNNCHLRREQREVHLDWERAVSVTVELLRSCILLLTAISHTRENGILWACHSVISLGDSEVQ